MSKKNLSAEQAAELLATLKVRFEKHMDRHKGLNWATVEARLNAAPDKLWTLDEMEVTGGEPDVTAYNAETGEITFTDCAAESPKGRRSTCYDLEAQTSRKEHAPENNAVSMAADMGIEMLTEEEYRHLQTLGNFDLKTSSWITTPANIRKLGGGLFCDKRYDTVFTYHNGVQSYYAARGFRGKVVI